MGSCISKFHSHKDLPPQQNHVAPSQSTSSSSCLLTSPLQNNIVASPPPPSTSSSFCFTSSSSPTCTTTNSSISTSICSKQQEEEEEEEEVVMNPPKNKVPQIVVLDPRKHIPNPPKPTPLKRTRSTSPSLTRQKSLRTTYTLESNPKSPFRHVGSPSPSRRFVGQKHSGIGGRAGCVPTGIRKEKSSGRLSGGVRGREMCMHRLIHPRVGGVDKLVEDLNNPLISMDCFIFL